MSKYARAITGATLSVLAACAVAGDPADERVAKAPPGGGYQKVSELVALPEFIPGMGTLYVQPETLPAGPFLAYDRDNRLVSTVYMIPLDDMQSQKNFEALQASGRKVLSTDVAYNAGHPGVAEPHYHIVLWHVDPDQAQLN